MTQQNRARQMADKPNLGVLWIVFAAWVLIMFAAFGLGVDLLIVSALPAYVLADAIISNRRRGPLDGN